MILIVISPLLPSFWGFSFALRCGVSFSGGIQHSPIDGCSAVGCGVLQGDECSSFYSAISYTLYSRKNEETAPKQKQHPVVDVTGDGSKV